MADLQAAENEADLASTHEKALKSASHNEKQKNSISHSIKVPTKNWKN